jgi:hypothetical protein
MTKRLVFVHGRAQEGKDSVALKAEWIDCWRQGLAKRGLPLPLAESDIRFPYYGDTLSQLSNGLSQADAAKVVVRGTGIDDAEKEFTRKMAAELRSRITDAQLAEVAGQVVVERGLLQWDWFQNILEAVDRHVPFASSASIALFTHDVYQYLHADAVQAVIDEGVAAAVEPGVDTVVVSHSLGTVVAYRLLRQWGRERGWRVPLFVTLGSPLALQAIRDKLRSEAPTRCPECVAAWFNAFDPGDVVALHPLHISAFPLDPAAPAIENKDDVDNPTPNKHGISGYLADPEVAERLYRAVTA